MNNFVSVAKESDTKNELTVISFSHLRLCPSLSSHESANALAQVMREYTQTFLYSDGENVFYGIPDAPLFRKELLTFMKNAWLR